MTDLCVINFGWTAAPDFVTKRHCHEAVRPGGTGSGGVQTIARLVIVDWKMQIWTGECVAYRQEVEEIPLSC